MKRLSLILLIGILPLTGISQYVIPDWVLQCPGDRYLNVYLCGVGIDRNYITAYEQAFINALLHSEGQYEIESISLIDRSASHNNSRLRITMRGNNFIDNVRLRDSYTTRRPDGKYETHILLSVPKPRELQKPLPSNTGAFFRSAVTPGLGQFYKQRSERGIIFMFIGILSGIVTYNLWSNAHKNEEAHQFAMSASVFTAILHILNIYDASTINHGIKWY